MALNVVIRTGNAKEENKKRANAASVHRNFVMAQDYKRPNADGGVASSQGKHDIQRRFIDHGIKYEAEQALTFWSF
jgi:hypothetical protein